MRKLRDAETVQKLQQIAEEDEVDSDDAFGPVDKGNDYNMVSNRSSYRQGTTSRDGKRPTTLVADV